MVNVGVCGDDQLTARQREIELPNKINDLVNGIFKADINENPLVAVEDQIDVAPQALTRLMVHFNYVRKDRLPREHKALPWLEEEASLITKGL
jgi:hypothetical protein